MNWFARLWGRGPQSTPVEPERWVVVDVETSGLDTRSDRLLAIAAVAVQVHGPAMPRIVLGDSFEAVLRQRHEPADKANILLHGIGVGQQRAGAPAAQVLADFERWLGASPLIAFHAAFDRALIDREMKALLKRDLGARWLDLAPVAATLCPDVKGQSLDDWLAHFGIDCAVRHQAAADALATAELLLRLWPAARAQHCSSWAALQSLATQQRWLGGP